MQIMLIGTGGCVIFFLAVWFLHWLGDQLEFQRRHQERLAEMEAKKAIEPPPLRRSAQTSWAGTHPWERI